MNFYDTAKRQFIDFNPGHQVKIYVCGITPYDSAHMGHIFTFMTYDLLQRCLEDLGHQVLLVRNITDVDEPIYAKAKEQNIDYRELALREIDSFHNVLKKFNFKDLYNEPKASEYIDQMATAVNQLVERNFGYRLTNGDIYFDTSKYLDYTNFAYFRADLYERFLKLRGGDPGRLDKRNPLDFLLWKAIDDPADPAQWSSVNGVGRPGWHIECSVMSSEVLGEHIDIHGGGTDLIFPHHSSEIAQSYGLGYEHKIDHWLHVSPLLYHGEKMSKSLGNLVFAKDLLNDYSPSVVRLALMNYHHLIGGEWREELLLEMNTLYAKLKERVLQVSPDQLRNLIKLVQTNLDNDLNTPQIIADFRAFIDLSLVNDELEVNKQENLRLFSQIESLLGL